MTIPATAWTPQTETSTRYSSNIIPIIDLYNESDSYNGNGTSSLADSYNGGSHTPGSSGTVYTKVGNIPTSWTK